MVHNLKNRRIYKPIDPTTENPVQHGLAYTPAKMAALAEKGVPISSMTLDSQYYDGDTNPSFDYGIEDVRGVDIAEAWEQEMGAKQSFIRGLRRDKEYYGD